NPDGNVASGARSNVVERWMGGVTEPVAGSTAAPACTASVSKRIEEEAIGRLYRIPTRGPRRPSVERCGTGLQLKGGDQGVVGTMWNRASARFIEVERRSEDLR